jgi:hypothetical protein
VTYYGDVAHNNTTNPIQVSAGSVATYFGGVSGPGNFSGTGANFFEGDLRPGASPALVTFGGDVGFGAAATVHMEIGGTVRGTEYDSMDVAGQAFLDGALDIDLINGFAPQAGQTFTVMTFGLRSGDFVTYRDLQISPTLALVPSFTVNSLVLTATPVPEAEWVLAGCAAAAGWVTYWRRRWAAEGPARQGSR